MDFIDYWGLSEKPFENTGDPKFFYYSPVHKEALVRLVYVIKSGKAGALLAGDYGTGKTTIANELLEEIKSSEDYKSVFIWNPLLTPQELLQEMAFQLGIKEELDSKLKLRKLLQEKLERLLRENFRTVIVVDEAHLMTDKEALEELRLLMNLQYENKFLATIIMMGQLELRDVINAMPQFKQRFAMFYVLKHLDRDETSKYIKHRLGIAGARRDIFNAEANNLVYRASVGRPRQINNICDMSLLVGSLRKSEQVDDQIIRDVIKDLGEEI